MKKLLIVLVTLVCGYAGLGLVAGYVLSLKIEEAERKLPGIGVAIARIADDQLLMSERMRAITSATLERGGTKLDEVVMMLGDEKLNLLALTYLGADWSIQRSGLLGSVKHSRQILKDQQTDRKTFNAQLDKKIKDLEAKKKALALRLKAPSDRLRFKVEMDDYDYQLGLLRSSHAYKEYVQKDVANQLDSQVKAKNEDALFKLATEYQASTVGTLNRVLAQKLAALRFEEAEPSRLRWQMSFFNIWPLNMICKMFVEVKNGNE